MNTSPAPEVTIWKTLTLSSLARTAALLEKTTEQGPLRVLAQEFSGAVDALHECFAHSGDVDTLALLKCSALGSELTARSKSYFPLEELAVSA